MTVVKVSPFRVARRDAVKAGPWTYETQSGEEALPDLLPGWDATVDIAANRTVVADVARLADEVGLRPGDKVALVPHWACQTTGLRGAGRVALFDPSQPEWTGQVTVQVPGGALAGSVVFSSPVILISRPLPADQATASIQGSVIWADPNPHRVVLEGGMTRFPIEVVSMADADGALGKTGWMLDWERTDLNIPASTAVRLLVNDGHEAVLTAIRGDHSETSRLIRSAVYVDVARQLITGAIQIEEFCEAEEPFDQESIGAALSRLMSAYFPHESASSLRTRYQRSPGQIEAQIQSYARIFES